MAGGENLTPEVAASASQARAARRGWKAIGARLGDKRLLLLLGVFAFYAVLFIYPLVDILISGAESFSTSIDKLGDNALTGRVAENTLVVSAITTVITVVLAYLCALVAWRSGPVGRLVVFAFVLLPFWTGVLVKNFAWAVLLQDSGAINDLLRATGIVDDPVKLFDNRFAVVVGMVHYCLPYAVFPIFAAMVGLDERLEAAARSLGANTAQVARHVVFPLTLPGVSAAALLVFIISVGFFITPVILGGPGDIMVANLIEFYERRIVDFQTASTLALLVTAAVSVLVLLYQRLPKEGQYGTR
jgi:ABC-type spermidine/putrescine transport system permease subunit I